MPEIKPLTGFQFVIILEDKFMFEDNRFELPHIYTIVYRQFRNRLKHRFGVFGINIGVRVP